MNLSRDATFRDLLSPHRYEVLTVPTRYNDFHKSNLAKGIGRAYGMIRRKARFGRQITWSLLMQGRQVVVGTEDGGNVIWPGNLLIFFATQSFRIVDSPHRAGTSRVFI